MSRRMLSTVTEQWHDKDLGEYPTLWVGRSVFIRSQAPSSVPSPCHAASMEDEQGAAHRGVQEARDRLQRQLDLPRAPDGPDRGQGVRESQPGSGGPERAFFNEPSGAERGGTQDGACGVPQRHEGKSHASHPGRGGPVGHCDDHRPVPGIDVRSDPGQLRGLGVRRGTPERGEHAHRSQEVREVAPTPAIPDDFFDEGCGGRGHELPGRGDLRQGTSSRICQDEKHRPWAREDGACPETINEPGSTTGGASRQVRFDDASAVRRDGEDEDEAPRDGAHAKHYEHHEDFESCSSGLDNDEGGRCNLGCYAYGTFKGISRKTSQWPNLTRYLNAFLADHVGEAQSRATWTSLALLSNCPTAVHTDKNNLKGSHNFLVSFGIGNGGGVWVQEPGGGVWRRGKDGQEVEGRVMDTHEQGWEFDPRLLHATEPFVGERWFLAGYTPRTFPDATNDEKKVLRDLGSPAPTKTEIRMIRKQRHSPGDHRGTLFPTGPQCAKRAPEDCHDAFSPVYHRPVDYVRGDPGASVNMGL